MAGYGGAARTGRIARWAPLVGALVLNLAVLYAPRADAPGAGVPGLDKVVHVAVFALLTWAGLRAGFRAAWFVPVVLAHAGLSEVVQATALPARSGEAWDLLADATGVALGAWLHVLLDRSGRPAAHGPELRGERPARPGRAPTRPGAPR